MFAISYLAKVVHPEAKLDPESVYNEYLQRIGLKYPKGRIFYYPELEIACSFLSRNEPFGIRIS
ncbi:MAG: hypothetical protein M0Q13_14720 [Methanothrix sp.]|jgi:hypothetical protein|nr:hypothetical protein [Methanothrix sp.]